MSTEEELYEARLAAVLPFAHPLAPRKLSKRVLRTVKKASKAKQVKRGVKEVVKAVRKGEKGLVVIAGDISPGDVVSHIPLLCEENNVVYVFVTSKEELGSAGTTNRPTSCVMVCPKEGEDYRKNYDEVVAGIRELPTVHSAA